MKGLQRALLIGAFCFCHDLEATQGKTLQDACRLAASVILGTVETVVVSSSPAKITIRVDRVVSGPVAANSIISATWPGSLVAAKMTPSRYRALWFLSTASPSGWEIMPIGGPNAPLFASALAISPLTPNEATSVVPKSCIESVVAILNEGATFIEGSFPHLTAMDVLLQEDLPLLNAAAPVLREIVTAHRQSASIDLKALAISVGIQRQDVQALAQLRADLPAVLKSKMLHHLALALLAWRSTDPDSLAVLGGLAVSATENPLRRSAADALMMIHTKVAVPQLARLLDSKDAGIRGAGIRGLSMFVKGVPVLTPANVQTMQYLKEAPNEFLDEGIARYVTINNVALEKESEFTFAWKLWLNRHANKLAN